MLPDIAAVAQCYSGCPHVHITATWMSEVVHSRSIVHYQLPECVAFPHPPPTGETLFSTFLSFTTDGASPTKAGTGGADGTQHCQTVVSLACGN